MNFAEAWNALTIGDVISVSDSMPEPSKVGGLPWRAWRSHNFTGTLVAKSDAQPRRMTFELAPLDGATVRYEIVETIPHSFETTS
ncbi:hypothetical protein [Sphingopyxis flava]|uniref:Uncharacterized protein n=1 Tax=Sphingopyxis flava TaxID=1507287 RepID=A0A1T5ACC6_9SPHN|nr:hypothetical protein [Sphingopyxis flava]SKB32343.1 hypothetical protein SAMN06295937_100370 [Sphingopyxis flava]